MGKRTKGKKGHRGLPYDMQPFYPPCVKPIFRGPMQNHHDDDDESDYSSSASDSDDKTKKSLCLYN